MGFNPSLCKQMIDREIDHLISSLDLPLKPVMRDALEGGQRLRPLLMLATTYDLAVSENEEKFQSALSLSLSLELVHTAALILDDLPCMDNAHKRRNRPPLHQKHGEMRAILSAVALIGLSMEKITKLSISSELKEKCVSILATAIGSRQMSGGQCLDLTVATERLALSDVRGIYHQKTGVLFEAAVLFACHYRQVDEKLRKKLSDWAERFGFLYQLRDDGIDQKEEVYGMNAHRLFGKKAMEGIREKEITLLKRFFEDEENNGGRYFPSLSHFTALL